jgi:FkbM family methyltransferase
MSLTDVVDLLTSDRTRDTIASVRESLARAVQRQAIAVVGSALLPQKCARAIAAAGGQVRCFIEYDARFWGRTVNGLPVLSPNNAAASLEDPLVVVGIWSPNHSYPETKAWLQSFGFRNIVPVHALFWLLSDQIGPHYQLAGPECFVDSPDRIARIYQLLSDQESRNIFLANLRWRVTLDSAAIPIPSRERIYFDPALFCLPTTATVVDCGAFDGDSLRMFLKWTGDSFGTFYAFEPDPISFQRLCGYVQKLPDSVRARIVPRQYALGEKNATLRFSGSGMPGSQSIDGGGAVEVSCRVLDDIFADLPVTYLKFDIEGAEWEALRGAAALIRRDRPILAVAIYHKPNDLFALPDFVMEQTPDYDYFIRAHDVDGIDLVLYAVPKERRPVSSPIHAHPSGR